MLLAIPSKARAGQRNHTYDNLPPALQERTLFFVPKSEVSAYADRFSKQRIMGVGVSGIGKVRQFIINYASAAPGKVAMLDDDLSFFERRKDEPTKLTKASARGVEKMFDELERQLDMFVHAGVAAREGANRNTDKHLLSTRMLRILAYNAEKMVDLKVRYDRLPVMEDFDVTLQLLRKGYANIVLNQWAQDQGTSNAPGGCSTYRTAEVQAAGAYGLQKLHPDFVTVVQKETKGAWGGGVRTDVRIAWKKAFDSAR